MFKSKNQFKIINIYLLAFLGFFVITNNQQVMAMKKDITSTRDDNQNIINCSIEEKIINLKNRIREDASKKVNVEKEISQERNNRNNLKKIEILTKISTILTKLIDNQKKQLKICQTVLKTLNDKNN